MSKPCKKELFLHQRDDWYKVYVKEHTTGHPDNEVFRFIPEETLERLCRLAFLNGMEVKEGDPRIGKTIVDDWVKENLNKKK